MMGKYTALAALAAIVASASANASVVISTAATQNMNCSGGTCMPTASDAVLNVNDLENLLASGSVVVTTTGSDVQAKDIVVKAALTWSSTSALGFDAYRSITVDQPVSVQGISGLTLATNDGGKNGDLSFGSKGNVTFANLSSSLTIDGAPYMLVNTLKGVASAIAANPSGNYALAQSYDAEQDGFYTNSPIPTEFYGVLEGLGNAISHVSVLSWGPVGFFSTLGSGALVQSFGVSDLRLATLSDAGGLAESNNGSIVHCFLTGRLRTKTEKMVLQGDGIGGLVFENNGVIKDSYAAVVITDSFSKSAVGGLVGINRNLIEDSFAQGSVKSTRGSYVQAGGLAGGNFGSIQSSYAITSITAGKLSHSDYTNVGGLIGENDGAVSDSYSTGQVINEGGANSLTGGLIGTDSAPSGSLSDTYWDTDTSGITNLSQGAGSPSNDPGITGLSTAQFQSGLPTGFDPKVWAENPNINNGLPHLIANPPPK